jgi:hypothetical protein
MSEIIKTVQDNGSVELCEVVEKRPVGRPKGSIKQNKITDSPDYWKDYHHKTNVFITCDECGCVFRKRSKIKHLKTEKHKFIKLKLAEKNI